MFNESCKVYERYPNTPSDIAQALYYHPQWVGHFVCNADFCIERRCYNSILLLHTLRGSGKLSYRGAEYVLTKGSIAAINCTELHRYLPEKTDEDWEFRFLHFTGGNSFEMYEHIYALNEGPVFLPSSHIERRIADCLALTKDKGAAYEVAVSKKISDILHGLILNIHADDRDKITQLCDYIGENYALPLSTQVLADLTCFSRSYFSTVFKKITGTTPHDYLLCQRLSVAKSLLLETAHSISKIAEEIGFRDTGTFIRAFKKKEGITPLQFKRQ